MGKKRNQKASRSEKRMQKLYNEAIKEVKERNLNLDVLPATDNEDLADENSVEEKHVSQKIRKKPKEVLEESTKKQEYLRKPRVPLCVPVSKLIPFKLDERGLEFPRDFRRDPTSLSWIPRSETSLVDEVYNARRSPSSDCNDLEQTTSLSCEELLARRSSSVGDILQIFPLRAGREDVVNLSEAHNCTQQLTPIYRQDVVWRETMRRASEPSRSIPAKHDTWNMTSMSLMVGRPELYTREKCKSSVSLAERRFRLRAATVTL